MKNLDSKSALLGLAAGVLVMFALGATSPFGPSGRFQVAGTSSHAVILDTATGKVWTCNVGTLINDPDFKTFKLQ